MLKVLTGRVRNLLLCVPDHGKGRGTIITGYPSTSFRAAVRIWRWGLAFSPLDRDRTTRLNSMPVSAALVQRVGRFRYSHIAFVLAVGAEPSTGVCLKALRTDLFITVGAVFATSKGDDVVHEAPDSIS